MIIKLTSKTYIHRQGIQWLYFPGAVIDVGEGYATTLIARQDAEPYEGPLPAPLSVGYKPPYPASDPKGPRRGR